MAKTAPDRAVAYDPESPFDTFRSAIDAALAENTLAQAVIAGDDRLAPMRVDATGGAKGRAGARRHAFAADAPEPQG